MACDLSEAMSVRVGPRIFSWSMPMGVKQTACTGMAVGGVVVAAKPRFHDDEIHSRFGEGEQARGP